jgi:hypothetical protein
MKRIFLTTAFLFLLSGMIQSVFAQADGFGIGVILGEPTGLSLKKWTSQRGAFDVGVGWSISTEYLHVHADYLVHFMNAIGVNQGQLPLYLGLGASLNLTDNTQFGARVPLGINYIFGDVPLDLFAEIAPGLRLVPDTHFMLEGGVGIRFWLK